MGSFQSRFCGSEAPAFVNGILAAVLREVRENPPSMDHDPSGPSAAVEEEDRP